jgi:hypothetical protein
MYLYSVQHTNIQLQVASTNNIALELLTVAVVYSSILFL